MIPVLLDIGGIDNQEIGLAVDAVCQKVVHDTALSVGEAVVLNLAGIEDRGVIGRHVLNESEGIGSLDPELSHVRNIEDADSFAHSLVFLVDTYIFHRHVVSGKGHHLGAQSDVLLSKSCGFHIAVLLSVIYC